MSNGTSPNGAERTAQLTQALTLAGKILPETTDLQEFLEACHREAAVGPLLHPAAWMRAQKRLPALERLARAAIRYRAAWEEMRSAVEEEADPEMDAAAQAMYLAEQKRYERQAAGGGED